MEELKLLESKRVLVVDDEPDILETLEEILDMCRVTCAQSFEQAEKLMAENSYDVAILDIMGVNGHELLLLANRRKLPAVMLTSHALTMENMVKFMRAGAQSFIPKDKILDIPFFLFSAIEVDQEKKEVKQAGKLNASSTRTGKDEKTGWLGRLKQFYDRRFGSGWLQKYEKEMG